MKVTSIYQRKGNISGRHDIVFVLNDGEEKYEASLVDNPDDGMDKKTWEWELCLEIDPVEETSAMRRQAKDMQIFSWVWDWLGIYFPSWPMDIDHTEDNTIIYSMVFTYSMVQALLAKFK